MIQEYVDRFMANKAQLERALLQVDYIEYKELVTEVIKVISSEGYGDLDSTRITEIDHGDYQGTLLYIIAANNYQPSDFWSVTVSYGSCSGCDTLQEIFEDDSPKDRLPGLMTLALHIVQELKKL